MGMGWASYFENQPAVLRSKLGGLKLLRGVLINFSSSSDSVPWAAPLPGAGRDTREDFPSFQSR